MKSSYITPPIALTFAQLNFIIGIMDGIACKIGFSVLFAWIMDMGVIGFFWGTGISRAIPGIIVLVYFFSGKWRTRKLLTEKN